MVFEAEYLHVDIVFCFTECNQLLHLLNLTRRDLLVLKVLLMDSFLHHSEERGQERVFFVLEAILIELVEFDGPIVQVVVCKH